MEGHRSKLARGTKVVEAVRAEDYKQNQRRIHPVDGGTARAVTGSEPAGCAEAHALTDGLQDGDELLADAGETAIPAEPSRSARKVEEGSSQGRVPVIMRGRKRNEVS